jgi:hypothetical protein
VGLRSRNFSSLFFVKLIHLVSLVMKGLMDEIDVRCCDAGDNTCITKL